MSLCRLFLGIDPGAPGGYGLINDNREVVMAGHFPLHKVPKSPTYRMIKNRKTGVKEKKKIQGKHRFFDFNGVGELFDEFKRLGDPCIVTMENVTARNTDGAKAAFVFGGSFWSLRMALADRDMGWEPVQPKAWQKEMLQGSHKGSDELKAAYHARARLMFPAADLKAKARVDVAAALLIAEYGRRRFVKG